MPDWANSQRSQFYFLSREYPEWVGDQYDDNSEVFVDKPAWSGQVVFDAFGNPVSVNSALFAEVNPANLVGTGFDEDRSTGWVHTIAPAEPGSTLTLTDVAAQPSAAGVQGPHDLDAGGRHPLVVDHAAAVEEAVDLGEGEGLGGPRLAFDPDDVDVRDDQQGRRLLLA